MKDNINETPQEAFDKLLLAFEEHFKKCSSSLDDDFVCESKDKIPNIDYTDDGDSFVEFIRKQQEESEKK